ncbi:MAG TPA: hypothetical protein ENJ88_01550 [Phaeodactylibacter sp.]|nr:hypothetical protein [Phaeodactylibacter sp.]
MKTLVYTFLIGMLCCGFSQQLQAFSAIPDSLQLNAWLEDAERQYLSLRDEYQRKITLLAYELELTDKSLEKAASMGERLQLIEQRMRLDRQLQMLVAIEELDLLKIRYRKGIDLIKLLYEKILALDHHFSGMKVYQNISVLSNPNSYPEFREVRSLLEQRLKKRNLLQLPPLLESNPYLSATFSLVSAMLGDAEPKDRSKELERISCILDFTVSMNADLDVIRNETRFLFDANRQLKLDCERLFDDYVKVIGYFVPLSTCRQNDDWETLYIKLDDFIAKMKDDLMQNSAASYMANARSRRTIVNLEFATQRVADFIASYSNFIRQGTQYYRKFDNIITGYENRDRCSDALPAQYDELHEDIRETIDKFQNTYNLPEIQGSRLKDLLYGMTS